ncbi:MAG: IS256 family transposase [Solirubrobacteraceae bacterium]
MPASTSIHPDLISCSSEERSEPPGRAQRSETAERREVLPGLPGGPGVDEQPLEISDEVVDALLAGASTAREIAGPDGLLGQLTRRLLNRALEAELSEHLGYEPDQAPPGGVGNARNGKPSKTILTDHGPLRIRSPRDRKGTFEPQIVKKRQTRWVGFDDRAISLYARGLTVREIQGHLAEIYGTEVSPDLISKITDTVLSDAKAWQNRPLERVYPIVYLDALIVKIRDGHTVRNQACYVALGVNLDGERDVLGLWFQPTEGAKFWLHVLTDLKTRGVADILFVCVDGLTGFPEAIEATFPHATVQTCLVHQVRSSLRFVSYKDRKPLAGDLRKIYTAVDAEHAADELTTFAEKWDHRYPMISASWLEHWEQITPFLAYPADVRRVIYTTNSIEALHRQLRKIIKTVRHERRRRIHVGNSRKRCCARDGGSMALRRRPCGGRRQTALELR